MKRSTIILMRPWPCCGLILEHELLTTAPSGWTRDVKKRWSNVENAYQLRADKTKNLVEIVKGAADFERETPDPGGGGPQQGPSVNIDASDPRRRRSRPSRRPSPSSAGPSAACWSPSSVIPS